MHLKISTPRMIWDMVHIENLTPIGLRVQDFDRLRGLVGQTQKLVA